MTVVEIILMALSLSVDTFVVSMCGSVALGGLTAGKLARVSSAFAVTQTALLAAGWLLGYSVVSYIRGIAGVVGFLLLLYIGVNMVRGALRGDEEKPVDLSGVRLLLLAAVATSIDAAAVGVSLAMAGMNIKSIVFSLISVFTVTALAAVSGMAGGSTLGMKFGKPAQIAGGIVLIAIGLKILFG